MVQNDAHGNPPISGEQSAVNGIFVHPLNRPVQLIGSGTCTSHTGSVHIVVSLIAPCTLSVRLGTTLMAMHLSVVNTLPPTKLLYSRCAELKSSMAAGPVRLPQSVYIFWKVS